MVMERFQTCPTFRPVISYITSLASIQEPNGNEQYSRHPILTCLDARAQGRI